METKLHNFLNSNLLKKYLVGETSIEESKEVERFIAKYQVPVYSSHFLVTDCGLFMEEYLLNL